MHVFLWNGKVCPEQTPNNMKALFFGKIWSRAFQHQIYIRLYVTPLTFRATLQLVPFNPFSTGVPFWGKNTLIPSSLSPKRDCGSKRVKEANRTNFFTRVATFFKRSFFILVFPPPRTGSVCQSQRRTALWCFFSETSGICIYV